MTNIKLKDKNFPRSDKKEDWERYLNRDLTKKEIRILSNYKDEKYMNQEIKKISDYIKDMNLYIPSLSNNNGDCFFHCLEILNITNNHNKLRKNIAYIMKLLKNERLFNNNNLTLLELFNNINDIREVIDVNKRDIIRYDYDTMCKDLYVSGSWNRLPMELIIMVLSRIFNISFNIITNTQYINKINMCENKNYLEIYLGNIDESHYIPIKPISSESEIIEESFLKYLDKTYDFYDYGIKQWHKKNNIPLFKNNSDSDESE